MRAKEGVVERLNTILTIDLTAINQYFIHAEMCKNWGFDRMAHSLRANSFEEMRDAQEIIRHILYLEGVPNLQRINQVKVGESVLEDLQLNLQSEKEAVDCLTEAITHCSSVQDYTTRGLLEGMVRSEEEHIDWIETQLETINTIGLDLYLNQQIHEED